jgi:hypothetical protein
MTNPNDTVHPEVVGYSSGLTKREYFAALAMQGMLSNEACIGDDIAKCAVLYADALISELNNEKT